ncbi:tRNA synthetases class II-domain-containing protein [Hypoxylon sp. FL1150]|nr:tRNA synthetases class II-domain-containing protein [Hypoxylon sp. FL1150]
MVRFLSNALRWPALRWAQYPHHRQCQSIFQLQRNHIQTTDIRIRTLHDDVSDTSNPTILEPQSSEDASGSIDAKFQTWKKFFDYYPDATPLSDYKAGSEVVVHGFIGKRKDINSRMSFCDLHPKQHQHGPIQIVSSWYVEESSWQRAHQYLKDIPAYSPVVAAGRLQPSHRELDSSPPGSPEPQSWDLKLRTITCLNPFPKDIIVSKDAVWPPKSRHLQLRFDPLLRARLYFRSFLQQTLVSALRKASFTSIETPILFKSTPEGAREFLVPTRRPGYAYALTQSPQQYKQILMAGGIHKYFQFAKCFRDEDHRADRQPEFTQLDMEMAFATGMQMIPLIKKIVRSVYTDIHRNFLLREDADGVRRPVKISPQREAPTGVRRMNIDTAPEEAKPTKGEGSRYVFAPFRSMKYEAAMRDFGSDKPDLRIQLPYVSSVSFVDEYPASHHCLVYANLHWQIHHINGNNLTSDFIKMITSLENPIVDSCNFRLGIPPRDAGKFIRQFMAALPNTTFKLSPESTPAVFVYDSGSPLNGLSALGHEAAQQLEEAVSSTWGQYEDGDIVIMQARKDEPYYGSSTDMGRLRTAIHEAAVKEGLIPKDPTFRFLFVHTFPLFTPNGDDPGQGGASGFSSTHHPFTAPLTPLDFDLLKTNPLKARADHYDLVLNGVEIGGGSRRIHVAEVQEYIMRDILQMTDEGVAEFAHLIEALRAGCPPHAGFAFGFDRLVSVLLDMPSVKDVMAFPKSNKGEDLMVGSPSKITPAQQKMYHIFAAEGS